jgi:hypothetical protein
VRRLLAAGLCLAAPAAAFESSLGGYAKTLGSLGGAAPADETVWASVSRLRLDARGGWRGVAELSVVNDTEFLAGSRLSSPEFAAAGLGGGAYWRDLDWEVVKRPEARGRTRLHRATLAVTEPLGGTTATVGRQRVAWGTGRLWNPTDVLNPYAPTAIERDERPGVDAVLLSRPLGRLGRIQAVHARYAAGRSTLGRVGFHLAGTDVAAMGGDSRGRMIAGAEFATQALGAGIRGEAAWLPRDGGQPAEFRAVLSADRLIRGPGNLTVLVEAFHDSSGETDPARYDARLAASGRRFSLGRDYLGATLGYDLTPLLRAELLSIANLYDGSAFLDARLAWSARENVELVWGGNIPAGPAASEYGRLEPGAYAWAARYF